jgi:hypothetical protein
MYPSIVIGYVVNIHDSVNYDINLMMPDEMKRKFSRGITNTYTYEDDYGNERIGTTYRCRIKGIDVRIDTLPLKNYYSNTPPGGSSGYSSRELKRNISAPTRIFERRDYRDNSPSYSNRNSIFNSSGKKTPIKKIRKTSNPVIREAHVEMIRKINRFNGWVICKVHDIDIYKRILVSLYDPITQEDISNLLLTAPYSQFFSRYSFSS